MVVDDSFDQRPWCEILPRSALGVAGVLLQQPLVRIAFEIVGEAGPFCLADQVDHQQTELGCRIADDLAQLWVDTLS